MVPLSLHGSTKASGCQTTHTWGGPNWPRCCPKVGLARDTLLMPDEGILTGIHSSSLHCALEIKAASVSCVFFFFSSKRISVITVITTLATAEQDQVRRAIFASVFFVLDQWEVSSKSENPSRWLSGCLGTPQAFRKLDWSPLHGFSSPSVPHGQQHNGCICFGA